MTSRICLLALALLACGLVSPSRAVDPQRFLFQPAPDQLAAPPTPGLRFTGTELQQVRTSGIDGGYGYGIYGGSYNYRGGNGSGCGCGNGGYCADFTLLPWVGSWDDHGRNGGGRCGQRACNTCR